MTKSLTDVLTFRTGLTARNRVVLAPMTNKQSHADGTLSDDEFNWLLSRADGGFGLVMTCAAHVAKDGQGWPGELGIYDDAQLPGLTRLASALRERGAASMVQIFHGGVRADVSVSGVQPWSASEHEGARAANETDITRVIQQFAKAAKRAETAGFDGVELHGAHGYLLTQFLSTVENVRTDQWGGSLENRARLIREVARAVRAATSKRFTVGVRLSPEDFGNAKGLDLDESIQVAKWLADDGVGFIHLSLWRSALNTHKYPEQHALPLFRNALPDDVTILVAGAVYTPGEANALLALGADGIALARSAILNPDWPLRMTDENWEPQRPPVTVAQLKARGLGAAFAEYMKSWRGFVVDEPPTT
ncbi:MAG: NADH:flavin oxidoreductase [Gemmatimonadaceae bacterium]